MKSPIYSTKNCCFHSETLPVILITVMAILFGTFFYVRSTTYSYLLPHNHHSNNNHSHHMNEG